MPLIAAALLLVVGNFAGAGSWLCLLRTTTPSTTYTQAAAWHWCGLFFNTFLPSNTGGDLIKGYMVYKTQGKPALIAGTLVADRLLNLTLLLLIGAIAWLLLILPLPLAVAIALLIPLILLAIPGALQLVNKCISLLPAGRPRLLLTTLLQPLLLLAANPAMARTAISCALLSQLCKTLCHLPLALALGLSLPPLHLSALIPLFGVVSALPITIGGLGLRELTAATMANHLSLPPQELITLTLSAHLLVVITNLPGLVPLLRHTTRTATSTAASHNN